MKPKPIKMPDPVTTALLGLLNGNATALHVERLTADTKSGRKRNQKAVVAYRLGKRHALLQLAEALGMVLTAPAHDPLHHLGIGQLPGPFVLNEALWPTTPTPAHHEY